MAEVLLIAGAGAIGAALSEEFTNFYNAVKDGVSKMLWCKKHCLELEQDLNELQPIFDHICLPDLREEEKRSLEIFKETLAEGRSLVANCLRRGGWVHPFERYRHSSEFLKLRQKILQHLQNLPLLNRLPLQQVNSTLQDVSKQLDKNREDMIGALKSEITPLVDWVRQGASGDRSTNDDKLGKRPRLDEPIQEDWFFVGLDNRVNEVKSLLLSGEEEEMVMIVGGMGGIGKTTLAIAICNDPQVRGFFEEGIHFVTVSQSPDMKALLSSIWEKVVGKPAPQFQNEEDAYRQVKSKLLSMPSKRRLLVLDDVWSKANLEKLSFEGQGLKTMITTRQAPTLATRQSVTYNLRLLHKENAQSLFCYWAFGQDTIPPWVEDPLVVEEVISECKCLPLALKVIGASLSTVAQFPAAWRNARDKLREATPLGDHHEYALQRRLQTSIDALNPILRECFLDLGAYPEDSQCSADILLDIWVYVRGMAWDDAVLALVELGRRCLLDFGPEVTSADVGHALEFGNAKTLEFSQHDVMRDLALHLGRKDRSPSQRTRLLMPQRGKNVRTDWQSDQAPFAAQLISIRTGKQDRRPRLDFPNAEALLFDSTDLSSYHELIFYMYKLKVMSIRGPGASMSVCINYALSFSHLQSIDMKDVKGWEHIEIRDMDSPANTNVESKLYFWNSDTTEHQHKLEKLRLYGVDDVDHALFKKLGNLRHLKISGSDKLRQLPASVCKLQYLEVLEMEDLQQLERLPDNLGQLSALKELSLRNCHRLLYLPGTIGQLVALKKLDLTECRMLYDLPANFWRLSNLEQLSLHGCGRLRHLPEIFVQLRSLKKLDLTLCDALEELPALGDLHCLEDLKLDELKALSHLPGNVGMLTSLKRLSLKGCGQLRELPEGFGNLSCLEYLSLEWCWTLKHLPHSFGQLSGLRTLEMNEVGLESLPSSVGDVGALLRLESVECSESLMPLWEAALKGQDIAGSSAPKKPRFSVVPSYLV